MNTTQTMTDLKIPPDLLALAPTNLEIQRAGRYDGSGFSIQLDRFAPEDVSLLIQLYSAVKKTYDLWLYMSDSPNYELIQKRLVAEFGSERFLSSMQAIGAATYALGDPSPLLRKVIHDIRGGALTVLAGYASLMKRMDPQDITNDDIQNAVLNARDHAKLMRNAIDDIDPEVRAADESLKVHFIDDFANKWDRSTFRIAGKTVEIEVDCLFEGSVTNRCLETSAIDRILYNYINNAARFAADNRVRLIIFPVGDLLVRWVVENTISAEQQSWLQNQIGTELKKLFLGGITRGGQGLGLSSCADFVTASFGLHSSEEALDAGYLGAEVIDKRYLAWFHWPIYHPQLQDTICDCGE